MSAERLLTAGLQLGYVEGMKSQPVKRGKFVGESTETNIGSDQYRDEWFFGLKTGGGQELVKSGNEILTRLYAGGYASDEILAKHRITQIEIDDFLKSELKVLGNETRLNANCIPKMKGPWNYAYNILSAIPSIELTVGLEVITHRKAPVFYHAILISPVK